MRLENDIVVVFLAYVVLQMEDVLIRRDSAANRDLFHNRQFTISVAEFVPLKRDGGADDGVFGRVGSALLISEHLSSDVLRAFISAMVRRFLGRIGTPSPLFPDPNIFHYGPQMI
ncbi:hypothetical protein TB2_033681 [Malus domestica]